MELGLLALRLAAGGLLAACGFDRLRARDGRRVARTFVRAGWPATLVGVLELVGGLLLALGLLTFWAALLCSAAVLCWLLLGPPGRRGRLERLDELALLLLAAAFALAAVGPGDWSLDEPLGFDWVGAGWALLQLGVAWIVAAVAAVAAGRPESEEGRGATRPA
jgi:uncharacterized membrane protein YphA (DoxX/SURF4 family)